MRKGLLPQRLAYAVYFAFVLAIAGAGLRSSPAAAWDVLGYAGVVLAYDSDDPVVVHDGAYAALEAVTTKSTYDELTASSPYRIALAGEPAAFVEQLPFYRVRVLYTGLAYLFHKMGMNVVRSALAVSALSFILLSGLCLAWMKRYLGVVGAVAVSALLISSPSFKQAARYPLPDGLAAVLVVFAVFALLEKRSVRLCFFFLTLGVLARHDTLIPGLVFAAYTFLFRRATPLGARALQLVASSLPLLGAWALVTRGGPTYGWSTLFHHTFIAPLLHPVTAPVHVGPVDVARALRATLTQEAPSSSLFPWLLVLAICGAYYLRTPVRRRLDDPVVTIVCVLLLSVVARLLLFPALWDRFFLAHYLIFGVLSVRMLHERPISVMQFVNRRSTVSEVAVAWRRLTRAASPSPRRPSSGPRGPLLRTPRSPRSRSALTPAGPAHTEDPRGRRTESKLSSLR